MKSFFQFQNINKLHFHTLVVFLMTIISMKIIILVLDGMEFGLDRLQSNFMLEFILISLSLFFLFLFYDILSAVACEEDGLIKTFMISMRNEYDPDKYINDDYYSVIDESRIVNGNFVKEFNPNTFGDLGGPLQGVEINKENDVDWDQIDRTIEESISVGKPIEIVEKSIPTEEIVEIVEKSIPTEEIVEIVEKSIPTKEDEIKKTRIENMVRECMLNLLEKKNLKWDQVDKIIEKSISTEEVVEIIEDSDFAKEDEIKKTRIENIVRKCMLSILEEELEEDIEYKGYA